jgi:hypothetical protein
MHLKLHLASASASLMHYLMHPACEYASASIDADARCTLNCIQNSATQHPWLPIHNKKNKHQQIPEQLPPISTANDERRIQEQIYQPKTDRNNHR